MFIKQVTLDSIIKVVLITNFADGAGMLRLGLTLVNVQIMV